jgi:hypothetical protein
VRRPTCTLTFWRSTFWTVLLAVDLIVLAYVFVIWRLGR